MAYKNMINPIKAAQFCVIAIVISMTRAFALVSLFEVLLVLILIFSSEFRALVKHSLMDRRVFLVMLFFCWVGVAMAWGQANTIDRLEELWSWRKLFLVPICFAIFKTDRDRLLLTHFFIVVCAIYMLASWLGFWGFIELDRDPAHLLENHSTQGVLFAGAALFCFFRIFSEESTLTKKLVYMLIIIGFLSNIIFVLTGKSSYLAMLVAVCVSGLFLMRTYSSWYLISLCFICSFLLLASSNSREVLLNGFHEIEMVDTAESATSMGIRIVMWRNTIELITNKPIFGSGSGSFKNDYKELVSGEATWRGRDSDNPHQQYLHIAAEQGLIGLLLFLIAIFSWVYPLKLNDLSSYEWCGIAIFLTCLLNSFANGHFSSFVEGRYFWIFVSAFLNKRRIPVFQKR